MIRIVIGFDQRESVAYHTFCQSILEKASMPVSFTPLALGTLQDFSETHSDGSNSFIYSRFLTPWLMKFEGWAIFADGDMVCQDDISKLWALRDASKAVQVIQHNYKTKAERKYLGNKNENYPRKNWSSLILWNCNHPKHKILTPQFIMRQTGAFLHRFTWLDDNEIGSLPKEWNWLTTEYDDNFAASLLHYTLGTPCFKDYTDAAMSAVWHQTHKRINQGVGD